MGRTNKLVIYISTQIFIQEFCCSWSLHFMSFYCHHDKAREALKKLWYNFQRRVTILRFKRHVRFKCVPVNVFVFRIAWIKSNTLFCFLLFLRAYLKAGSSFLATFPTKLYYTVSFYCVSHRLLLSSYLSNKNLLYIWRNGLLSRFQCVYFSCSNFRKTFTSAKLTLLYFIRITQYCRITNTKTCISLHSNS